MEHEALAAPSARRPQICFFFNAQRHQLLHGIGTAVMLARGGDVDVYVVSPAQGHVDYARDLADRLGGAPITFVHARSAVLAAGMKHTGSVVPPKLLSLTVLARWLDGFDAIALPERTSTLLKKMGVRRPRFIHLDHGAGDRAAGFDRRIRHFDFVLMAGPKHRERLMGERLITPRAHAVVGYPKFEAADAIRDAGWRPFANDLPTILYNPHFCELGSWKPCVEQVLEAFAGQDRYNLILAPHVRLLDGEEARKRWAPLLDRYEAHSRIHIDRGSDRAIDMTHVTLADLYLGDVSSQVYEYLRSPRPCLFLNPHQVEWATDENYGHWHFGEVLPDCSALIEAVDRAFEDHDRWRPTQEQGIARTFLPGGGAAMAADAIADYLREAEPLPARAATRQSTRGRWPKVRSIASGAVQKAVLTLPLLIGGWMLHEAIEPRPSHAASSPFVDRAVASYRTTLVRQGMREKPEVIELDPEEIRRATGIALPTLPPGWKIGDTQLYPSTQGDIVQVLLTTPDRASVSLVAMRMETDAEARPLLAERTGERIAYWERGDLAFALVGRLPSAELLKLASKLAA